MMKRAFISKPITYDGGVMPFSKDIYAARRARVAEFLGADGIALIPTGHKALRNGDVHFPFRPSSYFHYLTGFSEPDAILVIVGGAAPRSILFCNEKDDARETWIGYRFGPKTAQKEFGFDEAHPLDELNEDIEELARDKRVYYSVDEEKNWDPQIVSACEGAMSQHLDPCKMIDIRSVLDGMRLIKDVAEVEVMRAAAKITSAAHQKIMRMCAPSEYVEEPSIMEYQLEAAINYEFRMHGGNPLHAYPTIVAGGNNACTLHYTANDKPLRNGDLVLIDAGCEYEYYASDVTRTFPVNGKFSPEQKALYEIVLAAQLKAIDTVRPGVTFYEPEHAGWLVLVHGLIDLKILQGDPAEIIAKWEHLKFLLHSVSHFLGMDVHDVGRPDRDGPALALQAGMALTVEPGIYISERMVDVDPKWRGIGIRIEDDVLVTPGGHEVLTNTPKTVDEIESLARQ